MSIRRILLGVGLFILVVCVAFLAGVFAYRLARGAVLANFKFQPGSPILRTATVTLSPTIPGAPTATPTAPVVSRPTVIIPTLTPWDGASRVTILLLGLDYRDWQTQRDYSRSDTMILLTLDPTSMTGGILSIPRDMWVPIPGFQHGKINTAYYLGEAYKVPGGGPALATKTVEQFLGVPINYYAQIDFDAFIRFIDEIGGVPIDVPNQITIDLLGAEGVKTKKSLQPGRQVLPGQWALAYARARYTEDGDFDRARRQQQVIMGIRERMLNANLLPTIIKNAPGLYRDLASGIHTNLNLDDVLRLALAAKNVSDQNIQRGVLGKEYVLFGFSPDNLSILVPIPDKIQVLRDKIFTTEGSMKPFTEGNSQQRMATEAVRLAVYNGSGNGTILARTTQFLKQAGARVVATGQADKNYSTTTIIDHRGSPFTLQYLSEIIGNPYIRIYNEYDPDSDVDVELYLGSDWEKNNSLP